MRTFNALAAAAALAALVVGCTTDPKMATPAATFVGSETCGGCHTDEYKTWKDTLHAKMIRTPRGVAPGRRRQLGEGQQGQRRADQETSTTRRRE
jgi:hypothetical protein